MLFDAFPVTVDILLPLDAKLPSPCIVFAMLALICGALFSLFRRFTTPSPSLSTLATVSCTFFPAYASLAIPSTILAMLESIAPADDNLPTSATT